MKSVKSKVKNFGELRSCIVKPMSKSLKTPSPTKSLGLGLTLGGHISRRRQDETLKIGGHSIKVRNMEESQVLDLIGIIMI